jgi:hypothetical protein
MSNHEMLLKQAERMRNNLHDLLDMPNHSQAKQVHSNIEQLISYLHAQKGRDVIDNALKTIISSLERVEEEVMDFRHSNQLIDTCKDLRREAARL